jgi:hypothetical protein
MSRVFLALALLATRASADPIRAAAGAPPPPPSVALAEPVEPTDAPDALAASATSPDPRDSPAPRRHAIYLELLGKAGLWGAGYDWQVHRRIAIGAAGSYYSFDGDRVTTLAPYVAVYPIDRGHHRGFVQLGPTLERRVTPSPVPEWNGLATNRLDAELSAGYEYRNGILVRVYAMASQGDHLVPWLGASFGWTL